MKYLLIVSSLFAFNCGQGEALDSAKSFARQHFPNYTSVNCISGMRADSDGDGYISCTIFTPEGPEPIECATAHFGGCGNQGCRVATGKGK